MKEKGGCILMQGTDNVNSPKHYSGSCSLECIDVMITIFGEEYVIGFCLCNAFKYLWRHKFKNGDEDLKKAEWYINYVNDHKHDMDISYEQEELLNKLVVLYHKISNNI